jgi:rod shape-determining protein MreB
MFSAFKPAIYIQIAPERLTVRNASTGASVSEVPEITMGRGPKATVIAVGAEARPAAAASGAQVINPFGHPRSLVSDFTAAEQLIKAFLGRVQGRSLLAVAPVVVMHPLGDPAGGYTQVEIRALQEMALGAGASQAIVWQGRSLSDQEVTSRQFPAGGRVLS